MSAQFRFQSTNWKWKLQMPFTLPHWSEGYHHCSQNWSFRYPPQGNLWHIHRFSLLNVYSYKGSNYSKRTNLSFCLPTARTQLLVFQTHPINTSITKERIGFIFFIFWGTKEQAIRKHSSAEFLDLHHKLCELPFLQVPLCLNTESGI